MKLALAAANQNNCHRAAETVATLHLATIQLPPAAQVVCKNGLKLGQIGHPRGVAPHIICSLLKFLHTSPQETPILNVAWAGTVGSSGLLLHRSNIRSYSKPVVPGGEPPN